MGERSAARMPAVSERGLGHRGGLSASQRTGSAGRARERNAQLARSDGRRARGGGRRPRGETVLGEQPCDGLGAGGGSIRLPITPLLWKKSTGWRSTLL
jgi:hypothetical protein